MIERNLFAAILSPAVLLASCGTGQPVDSATPSPTATSGRAASDGEISFQTEPIDTLDEPWAQAFVPGTETLFVTTKPGRIVGYDRASGTKITVTGAPQVDYGGQGGLGDIAFLPSEAGSPLSGRAIYLSWVEAGDGDTRGAVVGRGTLRCPSASACSIEGLNVIWRQQPKVTGRGHFSHRLAFSPDSRYLFVASGDRQKMQPAQDTSNTLGTIVRLNLDGTPAAGNPLASRGSPSDQIWSWGHRNILGMDFDAQGRLWEIEHGPKGGDELNLVKQGQNYGWPVRSGGVNYDGSDIPDHSADDGFAKPAVNWTPVIAPGNMTFYSGDLFPALKGDLIISGLVSEGLVHVAIDGEQAREVARYPLNNRIRSVIESPDGALYVLEDGEGARLLRLTPQ
ncbi:MAG: PQQ-dependent sugar dehydrogenase [Erythrobacter sp.]|nr:PQQ-dependent sugar dehydrogenase [Erythrobacter sp.]